MAIRIKSNNQYIKLDLSGSAFFPHGILVSHTIFESENKRLHHKDVQERIMMNIDSEWQNWSSEQSQQFQEYVDAKGLTEENIHEDQVGYDWYQKLQGVAEDMGAVRAGWDSYSYEFDLNYPEELSSFGATAEFLADENRVYPSTIGVISQEHTNQTFTYECMYEELKKLFPNDWEDC